MFGIWRAVSSEEINRFCFDHHQLNGEQLDPDATQLYRSEICPYEGFEFLRINLDAQIVRREPNDITVPTPNFSYALAHKTSDGKYDGIISLKRTADHLYALNKLLKLKLTKNSVVDYMTFFGLVVSAPNGNPFYFFSSLKQISPIVDPQREETCEQFHSGLKSLVEIKPEGDIQIDVSTEKNWLLGETFKLNMPVLFSGSLFISSMHVSQSGVPEMSDDDALRVEGIFDSDQSRQYYELDAAPETRHALVKATAGITSPIRWVSLPLIVETALTFILAPLFLFQLISMASLGTKNQALFDYYDAVNEITWVQALVIPISIFILLVFFLRFVYLEVASYISSQGPSIFGYFSANILKQQRGFREKLGLIPFILINGIEFGVRAFFVATLAIYALGGPVWSAFSDKSLNFGQAIITSIINIPLLGWGFEKLIDKGVYLDAIKFSGQVPILEAGIAAIYSVVAFGVVIRVATTKN